MTQPLIRFNILAIVSFLIVGCTFSRLPHPDPLAGWHFSSLNNLDSNKAISDDYHAYIQQLPPKERRNAGITKYFEDEIGQHAVRITINLDGTWWQHVLIYDQADRRIKVMKYRSGGYRS